MPHPSPTPRFSIFAAFLGAAFHLCAVLPALAQAPDTLEYAIAAPPVGAQAGAELGSSVAVAGGFTVVGAPLDDLPQLDAGVVKVFDTSSGELLHVLPNPSPDVGDQFGNSVAISGTRVVVGAELDDTGEANAGSAYVYDLSSATPTVPVTTLNTPDPDVNDRFGISVAISGTRVVVGAYRDNTGALDAGSAYVYDLSSGKPTVPVATLNNPDPAASDWFGISVAISGTSVVVGAYLDDTGATDAGSAYLYDISSGTPTVPVATLNNPSPGATDLFGVSVAAFGKRVVVGASSDDTGANHAGSAYVYDITSATPTVPVVTLNNPSPAEGDNFGASVAIASNRVVVGAYNDDTGADDAGRAYVYDVSSATPTLPVATLNNPGPSTDDYFGESVAISGTRVVAGAYGDDTGADDAGSAYVYDLDSATPSLPVVTLNNPGPTEDDFFGGEVAISGTRVVVGAVGDDTGVDNAGSAYVYDLSSATPTVPVAALNNPDPGGSDNFGFSVAISGARVVVGAFRDDTGALNAGSAYVYDLNSATPTVPVATLNNPGPADSDEFGWSVAISGTRVVVGAHGDNTGESNSGSAYVYDLSSATPIVPVATLNNPAPAANDDFGISVAISGTRVLVGAGGDDTGATAAGTAYVYDLNSATPTVPVATLNNPDPAANDQFGLSVTISGDRAAVGAPFDNSPQGDKGSFYIYGPANIAPVAQDQSVSTAEDTALAITLAASDANGDTLAFSVVTGPANGSLSGTAPNLTYTPNSNFTGADSFTFKVNDGTFDSNTATVSITVTAVNDAPVANAQAVTTEEDTPKPITLTGSDADGNALTFSVVTLPTNGALGGTPPNVTYTPNNNFSGADSFTFRVNDGAVDSNPATVSITVTPVNDAPVANPQAVTTDENAAKAITLTGSDVEEDALSFSVVTPPSNGTLSGTPPDLTYTPNSNFSGTDSFTFKVNDGTLDSNTATVSITIDDLPAPKALNISTRLRVETGDNVMIGGFIITGNEAKKVIIRALGPSLRQSGVDDVVADPVLELRGSAGELLFGNDNWRDEQEDEIEASTVAPADDQEAAIVATLAPGAYTAVVTGRDGTTGVGLVEVYDLTQGAASELANISTRGLVLRDTNVLIGGFILGGNGDETRVVVRALGPSLEAGGVSDSLQDPTLDLRDGNGERLLFNDNWQDDPAQADELRALGLEPQRESEAALVTAATPGSYTAIVAGRDGGVGVGLVEVYNVR